MARWVSFTASSAFSPNYSIGPFSSSQALSTGATSARPRTIAVVRIHFPSVNIGILLVCRAAAKSMRRGG